MQYSTIQELIQAEEPKYRTQTVSPVEGLDWNMYDHIRKTLLYKHSKYAEGNQSRPFRNITRPILNLQYRSEGFDVKDIVIFVNEASKYALSFLTKKFHVKWARENELDKFIDDIVESFVDFGGALLQKKKAILPEVKALNTIAFCDQTNLLGGPIAFKHFFSPDELIKMKEWDKGDIKLKDLVNLSRDYWKKQSGDQKQSETPGKQIEVYEIHGSFPTSWLYDDYKQEEDEEYVYQMHICSFYSNEKQEKQWQTLFKGKEDMPFKVILRDPIKGRALGIGGAEEVFDPQVWSNLSAIRLQEALDHASKIIHVTDDPALAKRQNTTKLKTGAILEIKAGKTIRQLDNQPKNFEFFNQNIKEWQQVGQLISAATDPQLGIEPKAGTPFALQNLVTQEGASIHVYRRGKLASFLGFVYRDWILPAISQELRKGSKFLADLDLDELEDISDRFARNVTENAKKEMILNAEVSFQDMATFENKVREEFRRGGTKRWVEIFENEFKNIPLDIEVNIAGKQRDLAGKTQTLVNLWGAIVKNPAALQDPQMLKLLNQILEASDVSPISVNLKPPPQPVAPQPIPVQ